LRTYISFAHSRSSESSTMDCDHSELKATVLASMIGLNIYRIKRPCIGTSPSDDPVVKHELLALAFVCDEVADNIEDHLTGGKDHASRGPLSRLS
jgi:hypothetical protein